MKRTQYFNVREYVSYVSTRLEPELRNMLNKSEKGRNISKRMMIKQLENIAPLFCKKLMSKQKHKQMQETEIKLYNPTTIKTELGLLQNRKWFDLGREAFDKIDQKTRENKEVILDTPVLETVQKMVLTCGIGDLQMLKECFDLSGMNSLGNFMSQGVKWKDLKNKISTIELIR